jgi:hypothetical protein
MEASKIDEVFVVIIVPALGRQPERFVIVDAIGTSTNASLRNSPCMWTTDSLEWRVVLEVIIVIVDDARGRPRSWTMYSPEWRVVLEVIIVVVDARGRLHSDVSGQGTSRTHLPQTCVKVD